MFLITNFVSSRRFNLYPRSNVINGERKTSFFPLVIIDGVYGSFSFRWLREEASFFCTTIKHTPTKPFQRRENENWSVCLSEKVYQLSQLFQTCAWAGKSERTQCVSADCDNKSRSRLLFRRSQSECVTAEYLSWLVVIRLRRAKNQSFDFSTFLATKSLRDRWHMSSAFHANNAK